MHTPDPKPEETGPGEGEPAGDEPEQKDDGTEEAVEDAGRETA
jgi:hypothetical protein